MLSHLLLMAIAFLSAYFLTERTGLFQALSPSSLEILYSIPFIAASTAVLLITVAWLVRNLRRMTIARWLRVITVVLLVGGLWLSYLTGFSMVVVLTEGQTFYTGHRHSEPESVYIGRFASVPDMGVKLERLEPDFSTDGQTIERLEGIIQVYREQAETKTEQPITDRMPRLIGGVLFAMKDFGYSLRYALKSQEGRVLDSSFIYMRLFPPGSEDSFRLLSPHTYYVQYDPRGNDPDTGPVIGLRIVRNKDIVFHGDVRLSEDVSFEDSRIAVEEVRMWTKLSITDDPGLTAVMAGIVTGLMSLAAVFVGGRGRDHG